MERLSGAGSGIFGAHVPQFADFLFLSKGHPSQECDFGCGKFMEARHLARLGLDVEALGCWTEGRLGITGRVRHGEIEHARLVRTAHVFLDGVAKLRRESFHNHGIVAASDQEGA